MYISEGPWILLPPLEIQEKRTIKSLKGSALALSLLVNTN